jgi:hypothetical protein
MKSFIIPILCLSFGFLLGNLSASDHEITTTSTYVSTHKNEQLNIATNDNLEFKPQYNEKQSPASFSTIPPLLSNLIEFVPDENISSAMKLFLNDSDINELGDVSQFASRYLEEISLATSEIDSESFTSLNIASDKENEFPGSLFELTNTSPIYAHFDVSGGLASGSSKIFSRWVNLDSNSILFFDTSYIEESSDKNWVSFNPNGGWKSGNYEVTFYKFGSELKKLASQNFYIETKKEPTLTQ